MGKKVNPRRVPVTLADLNRAKEKATDEALNRAFAIMLTALADKEGYGVEDMKRLWGHINDISDSVQQGYVTIADMKNTLKQEYGICLAE